MACVHGTKEGETKRQGKIDKNLHRGDMDIFLRVVRLFLFPDVLKDGVPTWLDREMLSITMIFFNL